MNLGAKVDIVIWTFAVIVNGYGLIRLMRRGIEKREHATLSRFVDALFVVATSSAYAHYFVTGELWAGGLAAVVVVIYCLDATFCNRWLDKHGTKQLQPPWGED